MSLKDRFLGRQGTGWIPNEPDKRDYDYDMQKLGFAAPVSGSASLRKHTKHVLNQRATSSCVGHIIAGAIHILQDRAGYEHVPVSVLSIYYHARRRHQKIIVDGGTHIRSAMSAMKHYGIPDSKYWPFKVSRVNRQPGYQAIGMGFQRRGGEYFHIFDTGDERTKAIRASIDEGYPVGFGTLIGEQFTSKSGINIVTKPTDSEKILGGHALLCIGYKEDPHFGILYEIQNSWGDDYKEDGYVWFTEEYMQWISTRDLHIIRGWEKIQ